MNKVGVIYFSVTGSTKKVAQIIANQVNGQLREIEPVKRYSTVGAYTKGAVQSAIKTMKLPEVKDTIDISEFDTIYLGAPIWNYSANIVVKSFVEGKDFAGKKVIPFCTDNGVKGDFDEIMLEICKNGEVVSQGLEIQFVKKKTYEQLEKEIKDYLKQINY